MSTIIQIAKAGTIESAFEGVIEEHQCDRLAELSGFSLSKDEIKDRLSDVFQQPLLDRVIDRLIALS